MANLTLKTGRIVHTGLIPLPATSWQRPDGLAGQNAFERCRRRLRNLCNTAGVTYWGEMGNDRYGDCPVAEERKRKRSPRGRPARRRWTFPTPTASNGLASTVISMARA